MIAGFQFIGKHQVNIALARAIVKCSIPKLRKLLKNKKDLTRDERMAVWNVYRHRVRERFLSSR